MRTAVTAVDRIRPAVGENPFTAPKPRNRIAAAVREMALDLRRQFLLE